MMIADEYKEEKKKINKSEETASIGAVRKSASTSDCATLCGWWTREKHKTEKYIYIKKKDIAL